MKNDQREIWLNYFNKILFDKGIITETEKNQMMHLIQKECQQNSKNKSA